MIEFFTSSTFRTVLSALNSGFLKTLQLFFITLIGALPLGLVISFGSMSRFPPLRWLTRLVVWVIRGTPLVLQIIALFYVPGIQKWFNWPSGESGRMMAVCVAFIINYACYFSEIYRGGIQGVPKGQQEAGQVLGMTKAQIFRHITLLQMIKRIVPPISNEIITLVKDTSLARVIALQEVIWMGESFMKGNSGIAGLVWPLFFTAVYYLIFSGIVTVLLGKLEKKLDFFQYGGNRFMAILEVHHIEKHFGATRVLEDISFDLEQGQALAIIGSSGSGKTTLLRCLNFLEKPEQGTISVAGNLIFDAADPATQRESEVRKKRLHFGLVFQSFNLFPQYTALKNVTLARELLAQEQPDFKQNKKQILEEIQADGRELLAKMGLSERANHYPSQLSGGQQQRVAIARALALHPDILCFDEPTSALDPELTGEVLRVIRELAEQRTTMIIVTHEMAFARDVADQVIFMDGGVIVEQGDAHQVIEHPREERTRQFLARYSEG